MVMALPKRAMWGAHPLMFAKVDLANGFVVEEFAFSATLRDIARLGDVLCHGGAAGGEQIVPERVVAGITEDVPEGPAQRVRSVRTPNARASMSYHDYWWLPHDPFGSFTANGIHGQRLFVSPALDLVVVHYGAHVMSPLSARTAVHPDLPANRDPPQRPPAHAALTSHRPYPAARGGPPSGQRAASPDLGDSLAPLTINQSFTTVSYISSTICALTFVISGGTN